MPGYQLTEKELTIIIDSLKLKYSNVRLEYYDILCRAIGLNHTFDISQDFFVDSGIFVIKKAEAINERTRLRDLHQAKIDLLEAELRGKNVISQVEIDYLDIWKAGRKFNGDIISKINDTFELLTSIKQMVNRLEGNPPNYNWKYISANSCNS